MGSADSNDQAMGSSTAQAEWDSFCDTRRNTLASAVSLRKGIPCQRTAANTLPHCLDNGAIVGTFDTAFHRFSINRTDEVMESIPSNRYTDGELLCRRISHH